ncbi:MAG TPA: hypothetical protein VFJ64_05720 [Solirubrobacterales bacterium]|nr:hypothetical protein [Solirubrobacterales bacterium]
MKVVDPSPLLREAAEVLREVRNEVVVVGATAVEVALHGVPAAINPTRDVDLVVHTDDVDDVVRRLEAADLAPSVLDHERGFTWVRNDLKVQLIRGFHPFARGASASLPSNPTADTARSDGHREQVAFVSDPLDGQLWVATAACLIALKQSAFGRTRALDDEVIKRDFHDVYLLLDHVPDEVFRSYGAADGHVRKRVRRATELLADRDGEPVRFAAEEMVKLGEAPNQRDAEAEILIAARAFSERL